MIVFTPILENESKEKYPVPKYDGIKMNLDEFMNSNFEDPGLKYEWNNGVLEAEEKLKFSEQNIVINLQRKFYKTLAFKNGGLLTEVECYLSKINKLRIPDLCYLTKHQIENCKDPKINQVPSFVIEIISKSNSGTEIESKNNDYFDSGVKVVWNIYPELNQVIIHYSKKEIQKKIEQDICDTRTVIPDFSIIVDEIFK